MRSTAEVCAALDRISRVELATTPTPVHRADRLSKELGVPVWFKRDDLTGIGLGGNKVRGLEYLLADALARDSDCLVTGAGPQSNWTMLAALTAARCGLDPFVVCYGNPGADVGNLLLHRRLGTDVRFTGDPERTSVDGGIDEVAAQLRADGRRPYVIPRGGATPLGALGYLRAAVEFARQLSELVDGPGSLWLPVGSGGTFAGLLVGWALGVSRYDVVGVTVSRSVPDITAQVSGLAAAAGELIGFPVGALAADIRDGWIGPGYGLASTEGDAAADLVMRTESVFLDPVFGAKAMAAMIEACRSGQQAAPVAFLVSGGGPTLFAGTMRT